MEKRLDIWNWFIEEKKRENDNEMIRVGQMDGHGPI